jgi:hypothetical protein
MGREKEGRDMQLDGGRLYRNAVVGALGGLAAWALLSIFVRFETTTLGALLLKDALLGAGVGFCLGAALAATDALEEGWGRKHLRPLLTSAGIGALAGPIGLIVGEFIFLWADGGVWPRAAGWAIFGALLGAGQWFVTGSKAKGVYAALGGLLGGLMGGATYERLSLWLRGSGGSGDNSAAALTVGSAVGLIILGASICFFIGLVEGILRRAWLYFWRGPLEGQTRTVDNRRAATTIGKGEQADIMVRDDPAMQALHAVLEAQPGGFLLRPRAGAVRVRANAAAPWQPVTAHLLQPGDEVEMGKSCFRFRTSEEGKEAGRRA